MRRCPDCGFRVKDPEFRICPLCGVRMLADPDGQTVQYKLHTHEQKGENCLLPNQTRNEPRKTAEQERYRQIMEQQHRAAKQAKSEGRDWRGDVKSPQRQKPQMSSKTILAIVFAVFWLLIEACSG